MIPKKTQRLDSELSTDSYGYDKNLKTALPQILAVGVKNLLLLGYGMTLGFPTIVIPSVSRATAGEPLVLDAVQISWFSSINLICVPLGCIMSSTVTSPMGRRRAMQVVNIPFVLAWLMFSFSNSVEMLYAALCLTGLAGGLLEAPVLTYVAEITQPHLRGMLSATSSMCIIIGVFMQFLFGLFFYWRTVALINIAFPVIAVIFLFFVPESPHWLVSKNKLDEARKSLQWLRGWTTPSNIENEFKDLYILLKKDPSGNEKTVNGDSTEKTRSLGKYFASLSNYKRRTFLIPYFLVSFSFFVGHFGGMTTLQTYAVVIFERLNAPMDKYYATLVLGVVQILGSLVCVLLVHSVGKRPLCFISTIGGGVCCALVASYDAFLKHESNLSWIPTTALLGCALLTHTGIRLLPWILIGEVFTSETRSGAAGLSGGIGYIFGFLSNKLFFGMLNTMTLSGTYGLYAGINFVGFLVLYFLLPETEGKELREIEDHFAGRQKLTKSIKKSVEHSDTKNHQSELGLHNSSNFNQRMGQINPSFEFENSKL